MTDGERFDELQIQQFALLQIIHAISFFLAQIQVSLPLVYQDSYAQFGLSRAFFDWCMEHIDISELVQIEEKQFQLREDFFASQGLRYIPEHKVKCKELDDRRAQVLMNLDITQIAEKALEELGGDIKTSSYTSRKIRNR